VPLVLDLRIAHDRFGSSSDPSLHGNLHYPHNIDRSLIEVMVIKYGNIALTTTIALLTVYHLCLLLLVHRLHSEFARLLFLQAHRETERFFATSRVQLPQTDRGLFHFRRAAFAQQLKSRDGLAS
jgi:hypothetical protein